MHKPITMGDLLQTKMLLDNLFPPLKFARGADMHPQTANQLKAMCEEPEAYRNWPRPLPLYGIEVHERTDIPIGEVRECTCSPGGGKT